MRIGIDFDNTLVDYDRVFAAAAQRRGLIGAAFAGSKREVRDAVRQTPCGECAWRELQSDVYGAGIADAVLFDGADSFLRDCRARRIDVFIVSHKTRFGHCETTPVNLRAAAVGWMARHRFFADDGYGIPIERVFFESPRAAKLDRIGALGCTHFIDDLLEVFADPGFPAGVAPILFAATSTSHTGAVSANWQQIAEAMLDA